MRLWSLHPQYLDRAGLVAGWREALLAQSVLGKASGGYASHPQLIRFRRAVDPEASIGAFLQGLAAEADRRGYRFDRTKVLSSRSAAPLPVTRGQLDYEWQHLMQRLRIRSVEAYEKWVGTLVLAAHPLFDVVDGPVEEWERIGG